MGTRISLPITVQAPGLTGSTVADNYIHAIKPLGGATDALAGLSGLTHNKMREAKVNLDLATVLPLRDTQKSFSDNTGLLQRNLVSASQVSPNGMNAGLSSAIGKSTPLGSAGAEGFAAADVAITGLNQDISAAFIIACLCQIAPIQAAISKLTGAGLKMQRTMLAKLDKVKKDTVKLVKKAVSALQEVLPECEVKLKLVDADFRSILGKASTIFPALNKLPFDLELPCGINPKISINVTASCKLLANFDFSLMFGGFTLCADSAINDIDGFQSWWHENDFLVDSIDGPLEQSYEEASNIQYIILGLLGALVIAELMSQGASKTSPPYVQAKEDVKGGLLARGIEEGSPEYQRELEDIEDPFKAEELYHYPYPNSPEYKQTVEYKAALERAYEDTVNVKADLVYAQANLFNTTINTIDKMAEQAIEDVSRLLNDLEEETEVIRESVQEIFEVLETISETFDSPAVQEQLATACAETEFRQVLNTKG